MGNMGRRPKQMKTYKEGANQINILEHHTLKASLCTAWVLHANFLSEVLPCQSFAMILKATASEQQTYSRSDDQSPELERVTWVNP